MFSFSTSSSSECVQMGEGGGEVGRGETSTIEGRKKKKVKEIGDSYAVRKIASRLGANNSQRRRRTI